MRGGNTSLAALMKENANDDADGEMNARTMGRIFPKRHLRCFVRLFMENCVGQKAESFTCESVSKFGEG